MFMAVVFPLRSMYEAGHLFHERMSSALPR